ncbi:sulfite exporter TauE/SafE family protein [Methylocystis sp. FS]|uniref:sulfite exporter TauE/SafE family protein n=1 Tax=Methylocystis silviterrae TaxID=2743612 RepID=UPI0015815882|nr:sulfite exporter TauE/SafE family protein [Methylocystis silviterrae]NUJ81505.1 sulfite exporter TauE/SafE family protein [Methylocystis silviterrae]
MPALLDALSAINLLYSASGFFVGALVGFTGVGGGSLMTPILMLVFGVPPTTAVGTDLLYAAVTKTNGTLVHALHGTVDWRITRRLAYGSVPASIASLLVLSWLGKSGGHAANGLITSALGFALLLTAFSILFRRWILDHIARHTNDMSDRRLLWLTAILGVLLGVLVSISSVGAGAIGMTVLLALYSHTPTARLIGSDIAHAVPLTLIAGFGHWLMGGVDWLLLVSLLIGSLPGIAIGAHFATRVPDHYLRPALASVMALVGIKLSI